MDKKIVQKLIDGSQEIGIDLSKEMLQQALDFLEILQKWNKIYNLTAISSLERMITHHLLDSLAVAPYISGNLILDIGTGAGFPGIPLAIFYPQKKFVLLDSVGKKMRFLQQVVVQLRLKNVELVTSRVEKFNTTYAFDVIICRAVGKMAAIMQAGAHLIQPKQWLFMKGMIPQREIEELLAVNQKYTIDVHKIKINVPGANLRHLVVANKED